METKWISTKERLPDIDQNVLCFYVIAQTDIKKMLTGKFYEYFVIGRIQSITLFGEGQKSVYWITDDYQPFEPSHWASLPEPPKF